MSPAETAQFLEDFGPIRTQASRCIRCGFCNAACPTSNVISAYKDSRTSRGRLILLQAVVENLGKIDAYGADFKNLIDLCYACRRCVPVCPAGIPIPDLMSHARYAYLKRRGRTALTFGHRIYANYGLFDRLGSTSAPLSNWMLRRSVVRQLMEWTTHIDRRALMPPFRRESFESWFRKQPNTSRPRKIVYFVDSYANYNDPSLAKTVVALLKHVGYQVIVPPQKQSGMPSLEYGLLDKARGFARFNLRQLAPYAREGIRTVCSSPAASYLLKEGYGSIGNGSDFSAVSKAVVDMTEVMLEEYENGAIRFTDRDPRHVDYHYCCLSKALSLSPVTTKLLKAAGLDYRQVEDCCGGAGVWGTFKENYEMSNEIATKLTDKIEPDVTVLTESETCKLQIQAHYDGPVRFPIELLAPRVSDLKFA